MNKVIRNINKKIASDFESQVKKKAMQKMRARNNPTGVWFGLGMMGLIGWSIIVPTLLGVAFGIWLDNQYQKNYSWTLVFLIAGLFLGCVNVWLWMKRLQNEMQKEQESINE